MTERDTDRNGTGSTESGHTSGQVSCSEMFAGVPVRAADSGMTVPRLAELITIGQTAIDQAATSLSKFRDLVDFDRRGEPAVLGVITSTGYGYVRDDGIAVIPIGTLRA